jgi:hypothetical protein
MPVREFVRNAREPSLCTKIARAGLLCQHNPNVISTNRQMPEEQQLSFRLEKEMLSNAQDHGIHALLSLIGKDKYPYITAAREIGIGAVIPDVLLACWHGMPDWKPRTLSTVESAVVAYLLANGTATSDKLKEDLFLTDSGAKRALDSITGAGFALSVNQNVIESCFPNDEVSLVAFEFKMKRWNDALQQAVTYFDFANESYVIMDAAQIECSDQIMTRFVNAGVGLILQSQQGFRLRLKSLEKSRITPARVQAISKLSLLLGIKSGVFDPLLKGT